MPALPAHPRPIARRAARLNGGRLALAAIGLSLVLPCAAQWKWRDADGRIQYSDRPPPMQIAPANILQRPPGAATKDAVQVKPLSAAGASSAASAPAAPAAAASRPTDAMLEARKRQALASEAAQRQAQEEQQARQKAENCKRATDYVRTLESGMRIARVSPQGEREFLTDPQREQELANTQKLIASECR